MNSRKVIRTASRVLIALLVVVVLVLLVGDFAINRYINADGGKNLNRYLPINGLVSFESASIHPFRDFPHLSVRLEGLEVADSLAKEHDLPPLMLDELFLRVSIKNWEQKEIAIEDIELEGLTINLFDGADGYSNIGQLLKKKINQQKKNKKRSFPILSREATINIREIQLTKIDEKNGQQAQASIGKITLHNTSPDEQDTYDLTLQLSDFIASEISENSTTEYPIELAEAAVKIGLNKELSHLTLHEVQLTNGHLHLNNDSLGNSNFTSLFGTEKTNSNESSTQKEGISVDIAATDILVENFDIAIIDHPKNKHLEARVVNLKTKVQEIGSDTSALIDVKLDVRQLAFNTQKGAYLTESIVQGQIEGKISKNHFALSSPELLINQDPFSIKADIHSDGKTNTTLIIEKQDASTDKVSPLLTNHIQTSILPYDIEGPFYAKANISFKPGKKDPRVEVNIRADNKTVHAKGQTLKNTTLDVTFINRLYDDARQFREDKRNVRLMIHEVEGEFNDLQIASQDALITATPEAGGQILARVDIAGNAASASRYLKHERFFFEEGQFSLSTDIAGSLDNIDDLIGKTNLDLAMEGLQVHYPAANTIIPLRVLEMKKDGEKTIFEIEGSTENNQRPFRIRGEVNHVESLLFPGRAEGLQTEANIRASSISWEGLIAMFGKDGIFSSTSQNRQMQAKRSMKQTLSGLQQSFQPIVRIAIDTVLYGQKVQLLGFNSGIKFDDAQTLVLEETSFKLDEATITLDGELKINELDFTQFDFDIELNKLDLDALMPKFDYFGVHLIKRIHDQPDNLSMQIRLSGELDDNAGLKPESINADISYESFAEDKFTGRITLKANPSTKKVDVVFGHSGHPRNFNHILETDAYRFDKGYYTLSFQFANNFQTVAQMVEESTFNLTINDAEVYISELDITVPLTRIEVASFKNNAYYHLLLRSDSLNQELALDGIVNNIRHFAFKDTDKPYEIELEISSPRIIWDQLKQLITYRNEKPNQNQSGKALKESVTKVLNDFNPNIKLKVDSLEYSDKIKFNDIYAHAYLDSDTLKIDSAIVSYGDSRIKASLETDMNHADILPFNMQLQLTDIDIGETLEHFDYFNVTELREAKEIDGNVWFNLDMQAEVNIEDQGFNSEKTKADISVELRNLVVNDLQTINALTQKLKKEDRFKVLRFAPIKTQIKVRDQRIEIKETEIQSNAAHAFVEGTLDKKSSENLWISIPIRNIKKPNLEADPEKTGYATAGRKVFLKWISSEDEDNGKVKLHLRKKGFFRERSKAKRYKAFEKINRRERQKKRQERRGK